jgi:hypothetical protein
MPETQNYKNHIRFDPPYHFFLLPLLMAATVLSAVEVVQNPSKSSIALLMLSVAGILMALKERMYANKVQDRVIRLEERLRLQRLTPEPFWTRIPELTESQLVALRFASDRELRVLAERAMVEGLTSKHIKEAIVEWRPDFFRV